MKITLKRISLSICILLVCLLGGLIMYVYVSNMLFLGSVDSATCDYLCKNKLCLDKGIGQIPPEWLGESFRQSDVYLLGESHGFADAQQIDRDLFFYLNKHLGVRYYLAEMDSAHAEQLNEFLRSEPVDTLLLKNVIVDFSRQIPQQASREFYRKWLAFHEYNASLADSAKISVLGIDRDWQDSSGLISRDSAMMRNFLRYISGKQLSGQKFYGFLGLAHVLQSAVGTDGYCYFAARLRHTGFRVSSFVNFTIDSQMFVPKNSGCPTTKDQALPFFNMDGPLVVLKGINELKEVSEGERLTLFCLGGAGSPYARPGNQKLIQNKRNFIPGEISPADKEASVLDFFQYVFLIRGSEAARPL